MVVLVLGYARTDSFGQDVTLDLYSGDSYGIGIKFDSAYTVSNMSDLKVYLGRKKIGELGDGVAATANDFIFECTLTSAFTMANVGQDNLILMVVDDVLGTKKLIPARMRISRSGDRATDLATPEGYDAIVTVDVTVSTAEITYDWITLIKGDAGTPGNLTGTSLTSGYLTKATAATTVGNSVVYENGSGNVGIGTTSPSTKLHLEGNGSSVADETILILRGNGENGKSIDFNNAFGSLSKITGTKLATGPSADEGILIFETATNSVLSEKMRLIDSGNLGIGTTSPVYKVDVSGTTQSTAFKVSAIQTAPATSAEACTAGEIRFGASYIYVCTSTNTWKRATLSAF